MDWHLKHLLPEICGAIRQLWAEYVTFYIQRSGDERGVGMWSMQQALNEPVQADCSHDLRHELPMYHMKGGFFIFLV